MADENQKPTTDGYRRGFDLIKEWNRPRPKEEDKDASPKVTQSGDGK